MDVVIGLVIIIGGLALYFLPAIIAFARNTPNRWTVTVLNTFLGWTLLGWIIFLAMSVSGASTRRAS